MCHMMEKNVVFLSKFLSQLEGLLNCLSENKQKETMKKQRNKQTNIILAS